MRFDDLLYEKRDGVARITIDRPERLNALAETTTRQICDACEDAAADAAVRVLVITGAGDAFCAGGDFRDSFERWEGKSAAQWRQRIRSGPNELVRILGTCEKPVVASINGVAAGGGATIALACDIRIASERASFAFPFGRIGLTPEFGCTWLLPRIVGLGKAMELLMLAETIDAAQAARIGLVNQVAPHAELEPATQRLVERLMEKPPAALGTIKSIVLRAQATDLSAALELEALALSAAFKTDEHRAAVRAFLERKHAARTEG